MPLFASKQTAVHVHALAASFALAIDVAMTRPLFSRGNLQ
jgi:hypothetical protein